MKNRSSPTSGSEQPNFSPSNLSSKAPSLSLEKKTASNVSRKYDQGTSNATNAGSKKDPFDNMWSNDPHRDYSEIQKPIRSGEESTIKKRTTTRKKPSERRAIYRSSMFC